MNKFMGCVGLASILLAGCGGGSHYVTNPPAGPSAVHTDVIRIGDRLVIRLSGVPSEDIAVSEEVVDGEGNISMPLVGKFHAAGLTSTALKNQIESAYRDRKIYRTPNISITTQERYISVLGEVRAPQRVLYTPDMTLLRCIAACGGFTDYANKRSVKILRGGDVLIENAGAALHDPNLDVPLQAGDQVQVDRTIF